MAFEIKNIDRAIEWALRDQAIEKGYWPDERGYIISGDEAAFDAAISALENKVDVFGVGNFKDRTQLQKNNIIVNLISVGNGDQAYADPIAYVQQPDGTYNKVNFGGGTHHLYYEVRMICDDVMMDRVLNMIIIEALGRRKDLYGMNDDLTTMVDTFLIERSNDGVNLSNANKIERAFRFMVPDIILAEEKTIQDGIPPIRYMGIIQNIDGDTVPDVMNPKDRNDVSPVTNIDASEYMRVGLLEAGLWPSLSVIRLYANDTEGSALKNLKRNGAASAVNSGLTFTAWKGFSKTAIGQYLDTLYRATDGSLTNFSYSIFVTIVPSLGIVELFGLQDLVNSVSFYLQGNSNSQAKANSNNPVNVCGRLKANTLYTLNSRDRFQLELWEGDELVGKIATEPTGIPVGNICELNTFDQAGSPIGTSVAGGIGFSAIGAGLTYSQIRSLNEVVRDYMTRVAVIPE